MSWLSMRWTIFWYNFAWPDYVSLLNGPLARSALFFPFVGYAILFNDFVATNYSFEELTGSIETSFFLAQDSRMRLVFFGLMLLAAANLLYRYRRQFSMKLGETLSQYTNHMMQFATAGMFLEMHHAIRNSEFDPLTRDGKYYDDDWDLFWREAVWSESGKNLLRAKDYSQKPAGYERVNFSEAKQRHATLLLSIIRETYFRETRKRRAWLALALALAFFGYVLMILPSLDLTLRVLEYMILGA